MAVCLGSNVAFTRDCRRTHELSCFTFRALLFVPGVIAFGSALPPSPGAIGVFEIAAVAGLLVFGYERETALSIAILWHGMQLLTTAILGGWGLSRQGRSLGDLIRKVQSLLQNRKAHDTA